MKLRRPNLGAYDPEGAGDPADGVFGLPVTADDATVRLLPVPWEATTSYGRGTARGSAAIRAASPQLDLFDVELAEHGLGCPYAFGIHMDPEDPAVVGWNARASEAALPIIEAGGVERDPALADARDVVDELSAQVDTWVRDRVEALLGAGHLVGVVGGDHSVPLGAIAAHAERYGEHGEFGVLHVDAHADLRVAYEGFRGSHASIMHNVLDAAPGVRRLVQVGIRDQCESEWRRATEDDRVVQYTDQSIRARLFGGAPWSTICADIARHLPKRVYVSFDIDGLDPALCPNTGTPVPGGLSFAEANGLLMALLDAGKHVVGFDLCEVAPGPGDDEWDANVGARILYRLCGLALHAAGARDASTS